MNSAFVRNVFIVMSGTIMAQAIGIVLIPVISRLFTPTDFGIWGTFNAVLNVVAAGVSLEYSQAIMLPKEKNDALHLFYISCLVTLFITCLVAIVCVFAPSLLIETIKAPNYWVIVLLVLSIFMAGVNIALQAWCIRIKAFKRSSVSPIIRSLSSNGIQLGFGYYKYGALGLIISGIIADVLVSINLLKVFLADFKTYPHKLRWARIRQLAMEVS